MTHEDGASFEKQEKYIMPKAKETEFFAVLFMITFFLSEMHQNESAVATNEWADSSIPGRNVLHHWVPMVMVCLCEFFFFFGVLSTYKSSK